MSTPSSYTHGDTGGSAGHYETSPDGDYANVAGGALQENRPDAMGYYRERVLDAHEAVEDKTIAAGPGERGFSYRHWDGGI